jgi:hypothetical protein
MRLADVPGAQRELGGDRLSRPDGLLEPSNATERLFTGTISLIHSTLLEVGWADR